MRTLLTTLLVAVSVAGFAQKKPKINQAISALEEGNLTEAKSIIDAAITHEKTKDDPMTWFYRGQIYAALDTANSEPGAREEALKAFDKALELDPEQKKISSVDFATGTVIDIDSKKLGWYGYYYNKAIEDYNAQDFGSAATNFETAYYINPSDTNAIVNAGYAASAAGDDAKAEAAFKEAMEAGVKEKTVYLQLYNYSLQREDYESALDIIRKGKEANPGDVDFDKYEVNLLIQMNKIEDAKAGLEEAIKADPQNPDLYFSLGVLKEQLEDKEGAMESYDKALEIDPNHYNSNFNKGVAFFNEANELIKERNALGYKETAKNKELTKQINAKLEKALPIWEKLYELNSTDRTVLETLAYIYNSLGMKDKYNKVQKEIEALD